MQAVILAAGKGERMGDLTKTTPKPLLEFKGKNLIEWKIEALPDKIVEVIIIVGYLGEKIQDSFGSEYKGKKISYIWDKEIKGTAPALWNAKDLLKENFLVMMGDDIYSSEALLNASNEIWSITVKNVGRENNSSRIETYEDGRLKSFVTSEQFLSNHQNGGRAFTGLYSMDTRIFKYPMVKLKKKEEWGLPQTLLQAASNINIKILETDFWKQITSPEDLTQ